MSKPRIFATCKAGCLWETVHRDEFLQSASIVKMYATDGAFLLEVGKKYKIAKTVKNATEWGFTVSVKYSETDTLGTEYHNASITFPACSKYDKYLTFRLLDVVLKHSEGIEYNIVVIAEVNGEITEYETGNITTANSTEWAAVSATVSGANDCYLVNEDANIVLEVSGEGGGGETSEDVEQRLADLEQQMADLNYKAISITGFSASKGTYEMGETVTSVTLNWSTNKTPTALTFDGATIDVSAKSKTVTGSFDMNSSKKSWTLKATDERGATDTETAAITFYNGVYYGVAAEPATYDSAFILGLTKNLRSSYLSSFNANAGAGQYIYYCLPARMGTRSFKVGGFDGGFSLVSTIDFTNSKGYTESYYIYRSDNAALGSTSVTVS